MTPAPNPNVRTVAVAWKGGHHFEGGPPDGPSLQIDGNLEQAPGPMHALLVAAAACSGADIVDIATKMKVALRRLDMDVTGLRAEEPPRRYLKVHFNITMGGDGLDEAKARRAIDLSIQKYCSVVKSLNPDIPISYDLVLAP